jgi:amino acid transporter
MSAFVSRCKQQIQWIADKPVLVLLIAVVILLFSLFRMRENNSSAGMYTIVVIAAFLFIWALGQMTGLGFGMSF